MLGFALPVFSIPPSESLMRSALLHMWPNLIAYFLSFSVIGIMWHNHHALYHLVEHIDRRTVFYNLMLLAVTAFIPFATSLLGAYPTMRPTTFLYGLTLTAASTAYNVMLNHLVSSHAFAPEVGEPTIRGTIFAYRVGWVTYAVAMLVSLLAPLVSFALYVAITIFYLIPRGLDTDAGGRAR